MKDIGDNVPSLLKGKTKELRYDKQYLRFINAVAEGIQFEDKITLRHKVFKFRDFFDEFRGQGNLRLLWKARAWFRREVARNREMR